MLTDPNFYAVAIPAVALVGLSKGGLGGAFALIGVPLLAIAVPPMQAAAIFLPILLVMDAVALWAWRHHNNRATLITMLPGAIIGIGLAWATSSYVSADAMRLVLGLISVVFALRYFVESWAAHQGRETAPAPERPVSGSIWGAFSGYASFIAHAGGPPFQIYVLPLKLDPKTYTGASTRFFAILNAIKVIPYFALGELDGTNLTLSGTLLPVALVSTLIGARLVRHLKPQVFYPLMYGMVLIAGGKLLYDGARALLGT
ncbi:MAG: sulfite exporter TauE/SafE family protein [Rhizobium sp.]|nr:sulfite exporter TauE/SafE family protein [Rhizobium sp.]